VIAAAIAGSQKTLPVGLLILADPALSARPMPFLGIPLLVYHAVQLLADGWLADWLRKGPASRAEG
jgi:predicted Na+-dependent transporter